MNPQPEEIIIEDTKEEVKDEAPVEEKIEDQPIDVNDDTQGFSIEEEENK